MAKLDKDLKKVGRLEAETAAQSRKLALPGLAGVFLAACVIFAAAFVAEGPMALYVTLGVLVAGYMALNIGANDVANNMAPAVGSRALTMAGALAIAAVCEAAGAIIAGGDVVATVSRNIVSPPSDMDVAAFILMMLSALLASAIWVNIATLLGAPVSTTHAVVGAVVGSGIAAMGTGAVNWPVMGGIAASWVISPLMGGLIAAAMLLFIKWAILFRQDRIAAARRWVPMLVALMAGVFTLYMIGKGLSRVMTVSDGMTLALALGAFALAWALSRPWVMRRSRHMENRNKEVGRLFVPPLIVAAALLSFAHGANDVANAVGPLAAIVAAAREGMAAPAQAPLPVWVLVIGAMGLSLGLALFGPRLIRTVGQEITKMDPMRAWCVALSAAITVLVASHLGMPISSTHTAVGAIFGVGFLREVIANNGWRRRPPQDRRPVPASSLNLTPEQALKKLRKRERRKLVRRRHAWGIGAAWIITVPAAATLSGVTYLALALALLRS